MPGEPSMDVVSDAELQAATFAGLLWTAIDITGGMRRAGPQPWHFPGAYDASWLAAGSRLPCSMTGMNSIAMSMAGRSGWRTPVARACGPANTSTGTVTRLGIP
jgi:hypothetical protein